MTVEISNQIHHYLTPIVTHLTGWFEQHKYIKNNPEKITEFKAKWENEQTLQLEKCCARMTHEQQSELLYFYRINDIIAQSTKRFGRPFYMRDADIVKSTPSFVNVCHEGFTSSLIEQLLWTELQDHIYFIEHSNE